MSDTFSVIARETLLTSYIFAIERRTVTHDGRSFHRDVAIHPGAVAVVAVNDLDQVGLIRQYRASVDQVLWEIPAGTIDATDHDPLAAAQRELLEELGVTAEQWSTICEVYVSPGWTNQVMHVFEARALHFEGRSPDGPEEHAAEVLWLTRDDARALLDAGDANDATLTIGLRHFLGVDDHS